MPSRRRYAFRPNARLDDGTPVRVVGERFRVTGLGLWRLACEFPDRVLRPVREDQVVPMGGDRSTGDSPNRAASGEGDPVRHRAAAGSTSPTTCATCAQPQSAWWPSNEATNPNELRDVEDAIGPDNEDWICTLANESEMSIVAWGASPCLELEWVRNVLYMLDHGTPLACLGTTAEGHPRHPLYVAGGEPLLAYGADQYQQAYGVMR